MTIEPCTTNSMGSFDHSRVVFALIDIAEDDEEEADISNEKNNIVGETEAQRAS